MPLHCGKETDKLTQCLVCGCGICPDCEKC